ncbi:radical SAM/SPASM domain-containing protein [Thiococcus pfennigii]|uniref:radical SAM/SPASM domain-containing protein n=1 Tax=Thiococcus pfennigii TaxID=1057 RepID=UPI0019043631|nr:radical SAM protein [Thiococcus pfennigii]MBK1732550.1 hypothetical protein [Thiococcus pfennigii]
MVADESEFPPLNLADAVTREMQGVHFVNNPRTGALSVLNGAEMLAFHQLGDGRSHDGARSFFRILGHSPEQAERLAWGFVRRLLREGWGRETFPGPSETPLASLYLTIIRDCNLACPYCYQGLENRGGRRMSRESVLRLLDDIRAVNADCHIVVTGGEPLLHPDLFSILKDISERGLSSSLLTNGQLLDDAVAARLADCEGLARVQVSLDGMSEAVNAQTRGRGARDKAVAALEALARHQVPFLAAPTLHDGNCHEMVDMALWLHEIGGAVNANDLRDLGMKGGGLALAQETLLETLRAVNRALIERFGRAAVEARLMRLQPPRVCTTDSPNSHFSCGMAHSLIDIDWNGDVYPCHLLKGPEMLMGNIHRDDLSALLAGAEARGFRPRSYEIPACAACSFMSVCGGGCRATAYAEYGVLLRESRECRLHHAHHTARLLRAAGLGA